MNDGALGAAIERWFRANARDLPWRRPGVRGGYAALVSEAMLQQTQAPRVVAPFEAFMLRFPNVGALAAADEQEVLAAWRGLGYYRRARHVHAAARAIVDRHGGEVPRDAATLERLPGVGRYTAGAIASIAFGERAAIVDGNVARVLMRVGGRRARPEAPATRRWLWRRAQRLVDAAGDPGALNEALMELGATVCTPAAARCPTCPIAAACVARREGTVERIPSPKRPARRLDVVHHAVVVGRGGRLLLVQRPATGLWARMWQPPTVEAEATLDEAAIVDRLGCAVGGLCRCGEFIHSTTHRTIRCVVFTARSRLRRGRWVGVDDLDAVPMSSAARRAIDVALGVGGGAGAAHAIRARRGRGARYARTATFATTPASVLGAAAPG